MTKKENFIKELVELNVIEQLSPEAKEYFETFSAKSENKYSENAIAIFSFMKANAGEYDNKFTAKQIGEQLDLSAKSVSSTIRKFITEGHVSKTPSSEGMIYGLTETGVNYTI